MFLDVTEDEQAQASVVVDAEVHALTKLGFEPLALVQADFDLADAATAYVGPDQDWFTENAWRATPVLRSADGMTVVDVSSWFGQGVELRFRSLLADGSLCETLRAVDYMPSLAEPKPVPETGRWRQLKANVPGGGRSSRRVSSESIEELWAAHRAHLAQYAASRGAEAVLRNDFAAWDQMTSRAANHQVQTRVQAERLGTNLLVLAGGGVLLAAIPIALVVHVGWALGWVAVFAVAFRLGGSLAAGLLGPLLLRFFPVDFVDTPSRKRARRLRTVMLWGAGVLVFSGLSVGAALSVPAGGGPSWGWVIVGVLYCVGLVRSLVGLTELWQSELPSHPEPRVPLEWEMLGVSGETVMLAVTRGNLVPLQEVMADLGGDERGYWLWAAAKVAPATRVVEWLENEPESVAAHLLAGLRYFHKGVEARGDGYFQDLSEAQIYWFEHYLTHAIPHLKQAARLDPDDAVSVATLIRIFAALGADRDAVDALISQGTMRAPGSMWLGEASLMARTAKWGGDERHMFAYARQAPRRSEAGSPLEALIVRAWVETDDGVEAGAPEIIDAFERFAAAPSSGVAGNRAWNWFAFAFAVLKDDRRARRCHQAIGGRYTEDPWGWYGDAGEVFRAARDDAERAT